MERALEEGVEPQRIAFVTFTRAAAAEAKGRAVARFGLTDQDLVNFRTLHSVAFRELGLRRHQVMAEDQLAEVAELTGELNLRGPAGEEGPANRRSADGLMTLDHYARTTRQPLEAAWRAHGEDLDWFRLQRFSCAYAGYKADRGLLDFTDMLTDYAAQLPPPMAVDLAIVDEAQDLTLAQWQVADHALSAARDLYVAGDDRQEIHHWAGAAREHFRALPYPREVLNVSYRVPEAPHALAEAVADRISDQVARAFAPSPRPGLVDWVAHPEEVDLSHGSWLLLARTRAQLAPLAQLARDQGVVYALKGRSSVDAQEVRAIQSYERLRAGGRTEALDARLALRAMGRTDVAVDDLRTYTARELGVDCAPVWHDALVRLPLDAREYYLACLRRGEQLTAPPRVRVDTVHGAKGAEAEHVLLVTDLTWRTWRGYQLDPDSEMRVLYVGLTRCSESLHLVAPTGPYGWPL
jgi:DNA helicase-2/ATP-dependent DNA helicase PcrA